MEISEKMGKRILNIPFEEYPREASEKKLSFFNKNILTRAITFQTSSRIIFERDTPLE